MAWEIKAKPFVEVCIPHWGQVSLEWVERTYGPLRWFPQPDFNKHTTLLRGILNLDTERNELVKEALKNAEVTHILFLDTDVVVEGDPNDALRMLLACNASVASALYRARKRTGFSYAMWTKNPEGEGYLEVNGWTPNTNWIRVDAIGLGFVLFKREVFERVPFPWFKWDKRDPSEDFFFCERLIQHQYEVRVLTDVRCSHISTLKILSDGKVTTLDV